MPGVRRPQKCGPDPPPFPRRKRAPKTFNFARNIGHKGPIAARCTKKPAICNKAALKHENFVCLSEIHTNAEQAQLFDHIEQFETIFTDKCHSSSLLKNDSSHSPNLSTTSQISSEIFSNHSDEQEQPSRSRFSKKNASKPPTPKQFKLNFAGTPIQINTNTIQQRSGCQTRLHDFIRASSTADRIKFVDAYIVATDEYFFERSISSFMAVYSYFITGNLHKTKEMCTFDFLMELDYWGLDHEMVAPCCRPKLLCSEEETLSQKDLNQSSETLFDRSDIQRSMRDSNYQNNYKLCLWNLFEQPHSSKAAKCISLLSMGFVTLSIVGLTISTLPEYQIKVEEQSSVANSTTMGDTEATKARTEPLPIFALIEAICIFWFTIEYVVKIITCNSLWQMALTPVNLVDAISIVPFYFELLLTTFNIRFQHYQDISMLSPVIRMLRITRVMRVLKLGRHSSGLQKFGQAMSDSAMRLTTYAVLGWLVVVFVCVLFFSIILYDIEKQDENSKLQTIPDAMWWCFVAITSVGYGDILPITHAGKMVASVALAVGILVVALPVTILVDNFWAIEPVQKHRMSRHGIR